MVDDAFQPCCPARPDWDNIVAEPLGKNSPPTMRHLTDEPARDHPEAYLPARAGQIRDLSGVSTMDSARRRPAQRALGRAAFDLTAKIIESDESLTLSTTKPLGTSEEIRMPVLMALIPPLENRKLASEFHQM